MPSPIHRFLFTAAFKKIRVLNDHTLLFGMTVMENLLNSIAIGLSLFLSGCAGVVLVGAGVGAGAFSYVAGNLVRVYEAEYQQSVKASTNVMEQFNFKQKEESLDGVKTIIEGYLKIYTPITIEVVFVDPDWTQIGVRAGYAGGGNLEISEQVHTDIAKELKRIKQRTSQAAPQNKKVNKPRKLQATSQKKKFKPTEGEPRVSRVLDDPPPLPQKTITTSTADINEEAQSFIDRQEKQVLTDTEKLQDKTEQYTSIAYNNEPDVLPPLSGTVFAPKKSEADETQRMRDRQEKQALTDTESKNKRFIYDPESALTIYSGSYGTLDDVLSYLNENPSTSIDIRAYTNSTGNIAKSLNLSRKRVIEIRNYFILHGISADIITAQVQEKTNFLKDNQSDQLRSLNNLVEITIR